MVFGTSILFWSQGLGFSCYFHHLPFYMFESKVTIYGEQEAYMFGLISEEPSHHLCDNEYERQYFVKQYLPIEEFFIKFPIQILI
jgi:hypothetical protein